MVKTAGGSALAIELIRQHADLITAPPQSHTEELLLALQEADNRN